MVLKLPKFKPKLHIDNIEYYLNKSDEIVLENDEIYELAEKITRSAYPSYEDQYDKRWEYFYLPMRKSKFIATPVWIMEYNKEFFFRVQSFGNLNIKKGNLGIEKIYKDIFKEILRFIPILKKDENILNKIIPYDIRTGKIKGRYILEKLLSLDRKKEILDLYSQHLEKNLYIKEISLNDYLDIAALCYKAAYQEAENLSNIDMYKRWADGRDGGMLSIKDRDDKNQFTEWYHSGEWAGAHPFEIVFSWHRHGIHLYPPNDFSESSNCYNLRVTNYSYAWDFIEMLLQLIKNEIPFKTKDLENVLDYLAGDTYFSVNKYEEHHFSYIISREYKKKYFPYIEWDEIKVVKWKGN